MIDKPIRLCGAGISIMYLPDITKLNNLKPRQFRVVNLVIADDTSNLPHGPYVYAWINILTFITPKVLSYKH